MKFSHIEAYTFGHIPKQMKKLNDGPSPNEYNLPNQNIYKNKAPGYSLGHEKRGGVISNTSPGPKYDTSNKYQGKNSPKISFGKSKKTYQLNSFGPGPQRYDTSPEIGKESPKYSFGKTPKCPELKGNNVPAFYRYKEDFGKDGNKFSIGKKKRNNFLLDNNPGVGKYSPNPNAVKPRCKTFRIGKSKRLGDIGSSIVSPGPIYNTDIKAHLSREPAWKIGTGQRKEKPNNNFPGPGRYNLDLKYSGGNKFGKQKREGEKIAETPGPGQYRIPCEFDTINLYTRNTHGFNDDFKFV